MFREVQIIDRSYTHGRQVHAGAHTQALLLRGSPAPAHGLASASSRFAELEQGRMRGLALAGKAAERSALPAEVLTPLASFIPKPRVEYGPRSK